MSMEQRPTLKATRIEYIGLGQAVENSPVVQNTAEPCSQA